MKKIFLTLLVCFITFSFTSTKEKTNKYKCMIQMINYEGEGAYIITSLLDAEDNYLETLYVHGDDDKWYFDITEWWSFYGKKRNDIDAITGATMSGGKRAINVIEIPSDKINKGYKLRFETAVEDKEYYKNDVEFELTSENLSTQIEGSGFIRYIRMLPQN